MRMEKKTSDGYVLKSEVLLIIQNYIRGIQMNDHGTDSGIPQLYAVMDKVNEMPTEDAAPVTAPGEELLCQICGKIIRPKITASEQGIFIETKYASIRGGKGNLCVKEHVCEDCVRKLSSICSN